VFITYYIPGSLKFFFNFHEKTPTDLLKAVDLCLEMSSDFNYNFCFVIEEIFELGNTTKS